MSAQATVQNQIPAKPTFTLVASGLLQRACACGQHTGNGGECAECAKKKNGFQRKLTIGTSNDPLEKEADRVADQVLATSAHSVVSGAPPRIQRYTGQATPGTDTAPASVDRVLAGSGRPFDATLRQDMELRFGHDFSQVRVHSDAAAEQSAQDVNAHAYTAGNNIVFGAGQFAPGTHAGRRLIAHELTHVVQQGEASLKGKGHNIQRKSSGNLIQRAVTETKRDSYAGLFELSRHNPLGGPAFQPQAQYDVRINFNPYEVVNCEEIDFVQTARSIVNGVSTGGSAAKRARSLTAAEGTEGTGIDQLSGNKNPYYTRDAANAAEVGMQSGRRTGSKGSEIITMAFMTDKPGFPGGVGSSRAVGSTLLQDFESCAICKKGIDMGVYYGCVSWGFDVNAANKFTEHPFNLVSRGTPSTDFLAAAKKWNDQTVPIATDDLPLPTHKTKQTNMTEAQLKAEIKTLETTLKGLAAGHVDIPQISFEIKVYKDILDVMSDNNKAGYSSTDIKAIQAVVGSTPNGAYDFDTIMKIKRWQVEQGLKGDGRFGPISKTKFDAIVMAALTANKGKGFTTDQIKKIQVKVGSNDDGRWGPITVKSLMVWQKDHSLLSTGEFDFITKLSMFGLFGGF